jgi:hypothetical protein
MDGLETFVLANVGGTLSLNECEHAADTSKARVGSRRRVPMLEGCHVFGATPLEPSHSKAAPRRLRQQLRSKQNKSHRQCTKMRVESKQNDVGVDAKQCLTDLAASTLQPPGRQLMRTMSGGEKDRAVWVKCG